MMLESWIRALILGALQGLTEFLPISSSAHLLLLPWLLGWEPGGLTFDLLVHGGTLLALILYFRRALGHLARKLLGRDAPASEWDGLFVPLLVGTLPVLLAGLALTLGDAEWFRNPAFACFNLAFFGLLLWVADSTAKRQQGLESLTPHQGFWIGVAQALALMPGVSRSGVTLTAALLLGLRRPAAARFAFLLGIPAISLAIGSRLLKLLAAPEPLTASRGGELLIGILAAFLSGLVSIGFLLRFLERHSVKPFVVYRLILSLILLGWLLSS